MIGEVSSGTVHIVAFVVPTHWGFGTVLVEIGMYEVSNHVGSFRPVRWEPEARFSSWTWGSR